MDAAVGRNAARSLPLARLLLHAADAVEAVRQGESLTPVLARCPDAARPGTQALAFEALRRLGAAEALRRVLVARRPPPELDPLLLTALALLAGGTAGASYSPHTLVDQAVEAARQRRPAGAGFVNAVLRRYLRERAALEQRLAADPLYRFNHPKWWVERLQRDWPQQWCELLQAGDRHAPMVLRVNPRRVQPEAYRAQLSAAGIAATALPAAAAAHRQALVLESPRPVAELPGFNDGLVSVQDLAAQWAAPLLLQEAPSGARVLDACAAPGGKTAHLLELADLRLLALDRDAARLARVDETLARLGLAAQTRRADAAKPAEWWDGEPFDRILLDAPCSASGIVRRHPDIRWLRRATDIDALAAAQTRLLEALWPLLRPGGRLLYATCSVFKAEGVERVEGFLADHADASLLPSPGHLLPLADNPLLGGAGAPAPDGFHYALLQKS